MDEIDKPGACTSEIPALEESQSQAQLLSPRSGSQKASLSALMLFGVSTSLSGLRSSLLSKSLIGGLISDDPLAVHSQACTSN